jgi:hypothetical protein
VLLSSMTFSLYLSLNETKTMNMNDRLHRVLSLLFSNAAIEDCDEDEGEDEQSESD